MILTEEYFDFVIDNLIKAYRLEYNNDMLEIVNNINSDKYCTAFRYSLLCDKFTAIENKCTHNESRNLVIDVHNSMHKAITLGTQLN